MHTLYHVFVCTVLLPVLGMLILLLLLLVVVVVVVQSPPHSLFCSSFAGFQIARLTDQALLIHCTATTFRPMQHVLSITAFCIRPDCTCTVQGKD